MEFVSSDINNSRTLQEITKKKTKNKKWIPQIFL